jgi:hypothetical protein
MFWNLISFLRGMYNAHDYWDWKFLMLSYLFMILAPFSLVLGLYFEMLVSTFKFILKWLFTWGFTLIPVALVFEPEIFARSVSPVSLFVLFIPYIKYRWSILVFVVAFFSVAFDITYRTNLIRIIFSVLLLLLYFYLKLEIFGGRKIKIKMLNFIMGVLFFLPLVFVTLGYSGVYNVFSKGEDIQISDVETLAGTESKGGISVDTRTFLYEEVTSSMLRRGSSFIFGQGGGSGYDTIFFSDQVMNLSGRYQTEVGVLNLLLYSGLIGVILYTLMIFISAFYAINKSNNHLSKMLGLFLAFRFVLMFIEDFQGLDLNFFVIWVAIGMCLSTKFRSLTNTELIQFFTLNNNKMYVEKSTRQISLPTNNSSLNP